MPATTKSAKIELRFLMEIFLLPSMVMVLCAATVRRMPNARIFEAEDFEGVLPEFPQDFGSVLLCEFLDLCGYAQCAEFFPDW
jgi:hypothetical protein